MPVSELLDELRLAFLERGRDVDRHLKPGVYQGVDLFFRSVETMLRTCIDWVRHPTWDALPEDVEMEIWLRHNPGVFSR